MNKLAIIILVVIFLVIVSGIFAYFLFQEREVSIMQFSMEEEIKTKLADFSEVNQEFDFLAQIPIEFEAEYMPQLSAINVYNPSSSENNNIEKSQLYITYFKANNFLTLRTVDITRADKISVNGRDAILYEITKKLEVPGFLGQPKWRNFIHKALDIRVSNSNPSIFYSFAYRPSLSEKMFNDFINSIEFK
ncbi:MAG: hypothetical protein AAB340_03535 [Patescibacteria group bacterium]